MDIQSQESRPSTSKQGNVLENKAGPSGSQLQGSQSNVDVVCDDKTILVNRSQKDNPLIKQLKGVDCAFVDNIKADYVFGRGQCAVFLSIKYHNLYPNYIYDKFRSIGEGYHLKVLVVLIDVSDPRLPLRELSKFAISIEATLMVCWSFEEAAKYIETYKLFRNKSAEILMEKQGANDRGTEGSYECVCEALSSVKKVTKTDAVSLISTFSSLEKIMKASPEALSVCPGLGPQKAQHLHSLFRKPFKRK